MKILTRICKKIISIAASESSIDEKSMHPDFLSKLAYVTGELGLEIGRQTQSFQSAAFEYNGVFVVAFPCSRSCDARFRISFPTEVCGNRTTSHIDLAGNSIDTLNSVVSAIKVAAESADKYYSKVDQ